MYILLLQVLNTSAREHERRRHKPLVLLVALPEGLVLREQKTRGDNSLARKREPHASHKGKCNLLEAQIVGGVGHLFEEELDKKMERGGSNV